MPSAYCFTDANGLACSYSKIIDHPEGGLADAVFEVGGRRFGGLQKVLSLRCNFFCAMFDGRFQESNSKDDIHFEQIGHAAGAFRDFLFYLHTGHAESDELPVNLHEVADFFGDTDLKAQCECKLLDTDISVENVIALARFGEHWQHEALIEKVFDYLADNAEEAFEDTAPWVVSGAPFQLLQRLFDSDLVYVPEVTLFRMVLQMSSDRQVEFLPKIRLPLIPVVDLMNLVAPSNLVDKDILLQALASHADPENFPVACQKREFQNQVKLKLYVCKSSEPSVLRQVNVQSWQTARMLKEICCRLFNLEPGRVQLWEFVKGKKYKILEWSLDKDLDDCGIYDSNHILLEELSGENHILLEELSATGDGSFAA